MQILDAEPDGLARARARDCQRIGQQPELVIGTIGGGDELAHLVVGKDDVAGLLRIRQSGESDFPRAAILDALVVLRGLFQCGAQAGAKPVDRAMEPSCRAGRRATSSTRWTRAAPPASTAARW